MRSIAARLKEDLETRGECVIMANATTGWFAVFPTTWDDRTERAKREGREGPNLVVYRTRSEDPRDHYVVPYPVARELLFEDTLTTSTVNGSRRWNLTLKNDRLHVSHRAGSIDVSGYHGARLLVEEVGAGDSEEPVAETTPRDHLRMRVAGAAPSGDTAEDSEDQPAVGAGFGRSEENRKVEEAAVKLVSETYRQEGWRVESVEERRCGFDLYCVRDGEEARVEVKGVAGAERRFVITAGELRCAREDDQFVLALVTSALSSQPVLERLPAARFRNVFTFDPIQYWAIPIENDSRATEVPNKGAAPDRGPRADLSEGERIRLGRGE
jgi:Protein NO VEIN, C-terminal